MNKLHDPICTGEACSYPALDAAIPQVAGAVEEEVVSPREIEHTDACYAMPVCGVCGRRKKPAGRDSMDNGLCDFECPGWAQESLSGHLWPSERETAAVNPAASCLFPAQLVREAIMDSLDLDADTFYPFWADDEAEANDARLQFADAVVARLRKLIALREAEK